MVNIESTLVECYIKARPQIRMRLTKLMSHSVLILIEAEGSLKGTIRNTPLIIELFDLYHLVELKLLFFYEGVIIMSTKGATIIYAWRSYYELVEERKSWRKLVLKGRGK